MKLLLLPSLCILGNWQLDNPVHCMLLAGYLQPNNSWNNDRSPLCEVFLDGTLCVFYHRLQGFEILHLHFVVILTYVDCFETPVTEGYQLFAPINKTNVPTMPGYNLIVRYKCFDISGESAACIIRVEGGHSSVLCCGKEIWYPRTVNIKNTIIWVGSVYFSSSLPKLQRKLLTSGSGRVFSLLDVVVSVYEQPTTSLWFTVQNTAMLCVV
jgi:hypothetical protein